MKQRTMRVEWCPSGISDREAVSRSSTIFPKKSPILAFFLLRSPIRRASVGENTNLDDFFEKILIAIWRFFLARSMDNSASLEENHHLTDFI